MKTIRNALVQILITLLVIYGYNNSAQILEFAKDGYAYGLKRLTNATTSVEQLQKNILRQTVKVLVGKGHGSGVILDDGLVLTAAHVVGTEKAVSVKTSNGLVVPGTVVFSSPENDVAFIRIAPILGVEPAKLTCVAPSLGSNIMAAGNPLSLEFVTSRGFVSSQPLSIGHWKSAFVFDMTIIMGNSGGPIFDGNNDVTGIVVGVLGAGNPIAPSYIGFGVGVPADTICDLKKNVPVM